MTNQDLVYVGTISGYVVVLDSETVSLVTHYSWHEGKVRSLLLLPDNIKHCLCVEAPPITDRGGNKKPAAAFKFPKRQFGEVYSPMPAATHECYKPNLLAESNLIASIGNGRRKLAVTAAKDQKQNKDITLLMWHS